MVEEETLIFQTAQEDLELYINQHIRKELSTMISVNIPSLITIQNEENLTQLPLKNVMIPFLSLRIIGILDLIVK